MRDFKFKAIYLATKTVFDTKMLMEHEHLEDFIDGVKESAGDIGTKWSPLLQYTGLKDEYGIEIYEGDILEFTDTGEEGHEYREGYDFRNIAAVCFENGRFELEKFLSKDSGVLEEMNSEDHETFIGNFKFAKVIGNIYEHPHLLEDSK